ncbi:MAG: hypothetical protein QM604_08605 [Microbacterium sp.]
MDVVGSSPAGPTVGLTGFEPATLGWVHGHNTARLHQTQGASIEEVGIAAEVFVTHSCIGDVMRD